MTSQPVAMVNGTGAKISHQNLGSFLLRIEPRPAQAVLYNVFLFTHMVLLSSISWYELVLFTILYSGAT